MGYDMYGVEEGNYFRYNIGGMGQARDMLAALGMLDTRDEPSWPSPEDFGFALNADGSLPDEFYAALEGIPATGNGDPEDGIRPEGTDEDTWTRTMAYMGAQRDHIDGENAPVQGLPYYKLGSNDGWLVTPGEIASALEAYRQATGDSQERAQELLGKFGSSEDIGYFLEFIGYLDACGGAGFRTY